MSRRARILLALFCLVAGAIVNIAVAWGCMIYRDAGRTESRHLDELAALEQWRNLMPDVPPQEPNGDIAEQFGCREVLLFNSKVAKNSTSFDLVEFATNISVGWPMLCMSMDFVRTKDSEYFRSAWLMPRDIAWLGLSRNEALPVRPALLQSVFNSVFYAAGIWLLIRSPFETRRRLRQWRGLCERCASPIGSSALCSECGHCLPSRTVRT